MICEIYHVSQSHGDQDFDRYNSVWPLVTHLIQTIGSTWISLFYYSYFGSNKCLSVIRFKIHKGFSLVDRMDSMDIEHSSI